MDLKLKKSVVRLSGVAGVTLPPKREALWRNSRWLARDRLVVAQKTRDGA